MTVVDVCAAVIFRGGRFLLATRPPGSHLAGQWEFPGGKVKTGESLTECMARELHEELGVRPAQMTPLFSILHHYPEKTVRLHFIRCLLAPQAHPDGREGQQTGWFAAAEIPWKALAAADRTLLEQIRGGEWREAGNGETEQPEVPMALDPRFVRNFQTWLLKTTAPPPRQPHPEWHKVSFQGGRERAAVRRLLTESRLHTVCQSARCPNLCDCWKRQTATFMILGETCTRNCRFCSVKHGSPTQPDSHEPERVASSVRTLNLKYAVITCVTRDDLPDGGAELMAATVRQIRTICPNTRIELLCSDYAGNPDALRRVLDSKPDVFGHNLETVARLTPLIRNRASYARSLDVLRQAADFSRHQTTPIRIKSGLMLGLGETAEEIRATLHDLRQAGVDMVTLGQYLQPTPEQIQADRQVPPAEFADWQHYAEKVCGFSRAVCGTLVRSSYLAEEAYDAANSSAGNP